MEIKFQQIGVIHSPHKNAEGTPIQPTAAKGVGGSVQVFSEYSDGLKDISGFSHIILIYYFHKSIQKQLRIIPFLDDRERGIFATRAPSRPNPIGVTTVELVRVDQNILEVRDLDILDNTPLLDIKPFVSKFDNREAIKIGWLEKRIGDLSRSKDDGRFNKY